MQGRRPNSRRPTLHCHFCAGSACLIRERVYEARIFINVLAFLVLLSSGALPGIGCAQNLYPVNRNNMVGFADSAGKIVIETRFESARPFREGLAAVKSRERWGFVTAGGTVAIPLKFEGASDFSEGLAAVSLSRDRFNFINRKGQIVIAQAYTDVGDFREGVAPVRVREEWFFIDRKGAAVEGLAGFTAAYSFSDGVAAVQTNGKWHFVNHAGRIVIDRQFERVTSFHEGLAGVEEGDSGFGFIDQNGLMSLNLTSKTLGPFLKDWLP